jgi:hypothetical protein
MFGTVCDILVRLQQCACTARDCGSPAEVPRGGSGIPGAGSREILLRERGGSGHKTRGSGATKNADDFVNFQSLISS